MFNWGTLLIIIRIDGTLLLLSYLGKNHPKSQGPQSSPVIDEHWSLTLTGAHCLPSWRILDMSTKTLVPWSKACMMSLNNQSTLLENQFSHVNWYWSWGWLEQSNGLCPVCWQLWFLSSCLYWYFNTAALYWHILFLTH